MQGPMVIDKAKNIKPRHLRIAFGILWICDGLLQLQPYMFQKGSDGFLGPISQNTMGPPTLLTDLIRIVITQMVAHQILATISIALIQILIGILLLSSRTAKFGLILSSLWAIGIWVVGEGVGQLIFPQASMLTGAPGAAIIYSILGIALWPRDTLNGERHYKDKVSKWLDNGIIVRMIWTIVWCGTALLELEPSNFAPNAISVQLGTAGTNQPGLLHWLDIELSKLTAGIGTDVAFVLLLLEFLTGWLILRKPTQNLSIALGISISMVLWISGQGMGYLFTGKTTDPNLGPAMVIFALSIYCWPQNETNQAALTYSVEHSTTTE